ncbi:MAG: hypothetical protein ABIK86_00680 [candidate division WOR-3 bacterium]
MKRAVVVMSVVLSAASGQNLRWVYHHGDSLSLAGIARAVVCAPDSSIYAAGTNFGWPFVPQMTVVGLRPDGSRRWTYERLGYIAWPSQPDFVKRPLAYGDDGNLYAAGAVIDTAGGVMERWDFTALSLTRQGQERWVYTWAGPTDSGGFAQAVTQGADGSVYAAGWCIAGGSNMILTVVGLTQAGQLRWTYLHSGHGGYYEMATDVVCGADGSIYVVGLMGMDSAPRLTVISLSPSGSVRWVYRHDSLGTSRGYSLAAACGPDGNIYVAGGIEGTGYDLDFAVVSLTPAGTERWVYRYNGPANLDDFAFSLVCAEDGTIYASGYSIGVDSAQDVAVVSLTPSGSEQWVYRLRTHSPQAYECPLALGVDGNIYAAGTSYTDSTREDVAVVSLTRAGVEVGPIATTAHRAIPMHLWRWHRTRTATSILPA